MESELRDWYLSTLGIVQYRLRSVAQTQTDADSQNIQSSNAGQSGNAGLSGNEGSAPLVSQLIAENTTIEVSANRPSLTTELFADQSAEVNVQRADPLAEQTHPQSLAEAQANLVSFRLACWRPCVDLLVIDSWPVGLDSDDQLSQLLVNILKSIGRVPESFAQPEFVDWPMGSDGSLTAAQDHLAMFLQGRHEKQPFKWLLGMGRDVRSCLENDKQAGTELDSRLLLDCGAEAILTKSLSEMIATPECKKEVWAAIRFLCQS
ncbi:MAG: hypothetical protein DRR06_08060 [Gammaproteobacteria bacterium]|nr:MAG: hypothetical protein DRR06_08060 [Gammaproteobacteria bacterium]RLA51180.1 MAG: hypothetical protein DRR42_11085 [Gammaproteobacteria bacterium]